MGRNLLPFLPQNCGNDCFTWGVFGAAPSPVGTPCTPTANLRLLSNPLLSAPQLIMELDFHLLLSLSRFGKGQEEGSVQEGQGTFSCRAGGGSRGEELKTLPAEWIGAVGGLENVFTCWTHFHFQNSVFLAALIFSLKLYLTVLRLGSVVI